jgi:hypothetical protein
MASRCSSRIALIAALVHVLAVTAAPAGVRGPDGGSGPALVFSTFVGSDFQSSLSGVAVDVAGNFYVAGSGSLDIPSLPPPTRFGSGADEAYIVKFAPDRTPIYVTYIGGSNYDQIFDIAVDDAGLVYVSGVTTSADFPVVAPPRLAPGFGGVDAFFAVLSADGASILSSAYLGPTESSDAVEIAVDSSGAIYVAGSTRSQAFPVVGGVQQQLRNIQDAFVVKIAADRSAILYATLLGGDGSEYARGIASHADEAYVVGWTTDNRGFPLVLPVRTVEERMRDDGFVTVLSADGASIRASSILGGRFRDRAHGIAVDASARRPGLLRSKRSPTWTPLSRAERSP